MASINRYYRPDQIIPLPGGAVPDLRPLADLPRATPDPVFAIDWDDTNFEFNQRVTRPNMATGINPVEAPSDFVHEGSPVMMTADDFREQLREIHSWNWGNDQDARRRRQRFIAAMEIAIEVATVAEKVNRSLHRKDWSDDESL